MTASNWVSGGPAEVQSGAGSAPSTPAEASPIGGRERIELLDVVRGFALFGVLIGNLLWTGPEASLSDAQLAALPTAGLDRWAVALWHFVGQDKANTLFAFLFGLGFAVQLERGERRGGSFVGRFARRLTVLLGIGLVHNCFVWYGDILHLYALTGFLLIPMRKASNRTLVVAGLLLVLFARPAFYFGTGAIPRVDAYLESLPDFYDDAAREARGAKLLSGSYRDVIEVNVDATVNDWILNFTFVPWIGYVLGRFLLGYWVGRNRYLEDAGRYAAGWRRLLRLALPFGLLGSALRAFVEFHDIQPGGAAGWCARMMIQVGIVALAASYLAAIVLLHLGSEPWRRRLSLLAPVGRMALTNYLMQSALYLFALYGIGLGLLDELGATGMWLLGMAFFAVQIVVSRWWLARFEFGPVEWLWRTLTYGRRPPFRRSLPASPAA